MFPIIISDFFFLAALMEVTISGKDVPIAIIDSPKKESAIFKISEIFKAELTVICAPNRVIIIERNIIGTPNLKGFLYDSLENLSCSNSILIFLPEEEFLKLLTK